MVDSYNLQASADIRVTAVILIIVTFMNVYWTIKSLKNIKYKAAQLMLTGIYLMPLIVGWLAWIQMMNSAQLKSVWFVESLVKAICLASFLEYIQRMIGWTVVNEENLYTKEKLYENMVTNQSPTCFGNCWKTRPIDSVDTAIWYLKRVRRLVYQLCVVFTITTIVAIIYALAHHDPQLDSSGGSKLFLIFSGINTASTVIALTALIRFGLYTNKLPATTGLKLFHKFIIIKVGLLFTEFQPIIVSIFAYTGIIASTNEFTVEEIMLYTNSLLVVTEMVIMSFLIQENFPLSDYDLTADERKKLAAGQENPMDFTNN